MTADMVRGGAVVIDVGTNKGPDGKLCGDVDFEPVGQKAGWISPVPGGVGPMTIAMLLDNTVESAKENGRDEITADQAASSCCSRNRGLRRCPRWTRAVRDAA